MFSMSSVGASAQRSAAYGQGLGPILLDQVRCIGNETNLFDCPRNPIGQHDCSHFEDASVTCTTGMPIAEYHLAKYCIIVLH